MKHFHDYVHDLDREYRTGKATEHTYRPALKSLLESLRKGIHATNEPRRIACGAPDFILTESGAHAVGGIPLGFLEAKDVTVSLDDRANVEQFERYRKSLHNLIITDYCEFRWYVAGELRMKSRLAEVQPTTTGK
jgi:hypothetical protein